MDWLQAVGWAGSALLVVSLLQSRVLRLRVLNTVACVVLVFFNGMLGVWPMVAMNTVLVGINLFFIVRLLRERHDEQAFEVLEVGADDEYLRHVLQVHGDDIARYQPDFDQPDAADHAFIVLRGDETVGVVVVRREGETARVRLDYVTRRYRDFTPGEFVWRRSGLFAQLGVTRIATSPLMVDAYYDRLGFQRQDQEFVLDL